MSDVDPAGFGIGATNRATEPEEPRPPFPAIADPAPLGLAAFALTTVTLGTVNANLVHAKVGAVAIPLAFFYGGLVQLLAGMWEFRRGNTFGAVAFSSYGGFWLSYGFYALMVAPTLSGTPETQATGLFLTMWGVFTAYMTIASLRTTGAVFAVFLTLTAAFGLLAAATFSGGTELLKIAGYVTMTTGVVAWYTSFAGVTNSTFKREVIPVWPLGD
jgi:succinate-acetate transporter protein